MEKNNIEDILKSIGTEDIPADIRQIAEQTSMDFTETLAQSRPPRHHVLFEYLAKIPKSSRGEYELTTAIEQMLDDGLRLEHYSIEGVWRDVGRPDDIAAAETML